MTADQSQLPTEKPRSVRPTHNAEVSKI